MDNGLKNRVVFLRGLLFEQAQKYQNETGKLLKQSESCLLEEKGMLLLRAHNIQGMVHGIVEAMGLIDLALNPPPENDNKPKIVLAGGYDTIN